MNSGKIPGVDETWKNVDVALRMGCRGLPGGSSLANFLGEHRGHRHNFNAPRLNVGQILAWADEHHMRTKRSPTKSSGAVHGQPGEVWERIAESMRLGLRGLKRGSLADLLAKHRGVRNKSKLPRLTYRQILVWADDHFSKMGRWPVSTSGQVIGAPEGQTWWGVYQALYDGFRGLPGGGTLREFLMKHRRA